MSFNASIHVFNSETAAQIQTSEIYGALESEFYGNLVYTFKKLIGRNIFFFSVQKNHFTLQTYRI